MGYSNSFKLKIAKAQSIIINTLVCPNCQKEGSGKFCSECGTKLEGIDKEIEIDSKQIISELLEFSEEAAFLLDENGGTEESGSGYDIQEDIQEFSKRYPEALFQLDVIWDSGFGDPPSRFYYCNGRVQDASPKMVYDEFDPEKLS